MLAQLILRLADFHRRMMVVYCAALGPRLSYRIMALLATALYRLVPFLRTRSEAQCRAVLGPRLGHEQAARVAREAFVHRIWQIADLYVAERLLHRGTLDRVGGRLPEPYLTRLVDAQRRGQAAILLSCYYSAFDLIPVFLGYSGVPAATIYNRHPNPAFDAQRQRVRARGGCPLVPLEQAQFRVPQILEAGGSLAMIADHPAEKRGLAVTFLGLPTLARKSVGLLAMQYRADVVVAAIRRRGADFRFEWDVADVIDHTEYADQPDPLRYITERYLRAIEQIIWRDPSQYMWVFPRWGEQTAAQLAAGSA